LKPLLTLENVSASLQIKKGLLGYRTIQPVHAVSLSIAEGETVALVGESGCGKSTIGRLALRLIEPSSGQIVFDGTDVTHSKEENLKWFRKRVQAVFQDPFSSMNPYMNVKQILEEPLLIHGVGEPDGRTGLMKKILGEVRLSPPEDFLYKYPHMLSGGQRQRVGIARALMLEPDFILADEPVSMIDASSRAEILHVMQELQDRRGLSFLYITHDIATARHFSDRIAIMYLGKIVEIGASEQVIKHPKHPYTKGLIDAVPDANPDNRLRERPTLKGEPPSITDIPAGCRFHPRCPYFMEALCEVREPELRRRETEVACHLY
jgi:peptide/nickel transport system ATP-binding protein